MNPLSKGPEVKMWEVWAITATSVVVSLFLLAGLASAGFGLAAVLAAGIAKELIP